MNIVSKRVLWRVLAWNSVNTVSEQALWKNFDIALERAVFLAAARTVRNSESIALKRDDL